MSGRLDTSNATDRVDCQARLGTGDGLGQQHVRALRAPEPVATERDQDEARQSIPRSLLRIDEHGNVSYGVGTPMYVTASRDCVSGVQAVWAKHQPTDLSTRMSE